MTRMNRAKWFGVLGGLLLGSSAAFAAGFLTNGLPAAGGSQYPTTVPLTGAETVPVDTNLAGGANPQSESVTTYQVGSFVNGLPSRGNALIGGDATTNLWQRATTGASVTTTVTYGGPDRWAYWSGTNTAMTVSRDSTASDITAGYQYAFKMARTSGQTGVVQVCMAQEIESSNVYQFQGSTAELDFHAYTGANFTGATAANMTAYIIYGTGVDEGMQKLAWGLNAGGGGSVGWTGQTNATAAVISLQAVSTAGRYAAVANIPATATEMGVALCWTPVGTASTNDYIAFEGIQLIRNPANASYASATVGYNAATFPAASFERRNTSLEALLQYRYFYNISEGAAVQTRALCHDIDVTHTDCMINFPIPMRIAPVFSGDGGLTAGFAVPTTTAGTTLGACSALALSTNVAATVASTLTALLTCTATTVPAAGTVDIMYDNNGSGRIKASAEL